MRRLLNLLIIICLWHLASQAQPLRINVSDHKPDEFTVAVDPNNPRVVVAAANINHLYCSDDGGRNFTERIIKSSFGVYGDPVLRFDTFGRLFMLHLARNSKWSRTSNDFYQSLDRIVVQISLDQGKTFSDGYSVGFTEGRMQDKPWIAFGPDGRIYISWTEFDVYGSEAPDCRSRIRVFSANSDWTDTATVTISDRSGDCLDDDETVEGATIAFGSHGQVFCAWAGHGNIYIDQSNDQGKTWGKDRVITTQNGGWTQDVDNIYRTNGLPFLGNDASGNLYLVYAEGCRMPACTRTVLRGSSDGGINWNLLCYPDITLPEAGHYSFSPNMMYNLNSQTIGLIFYGNDLSVSRRFGRVIGVIYDPLTGHYTKRRISNVFAFPGKKVFFGDYIDLAPTGNGFTAVWNQPDSFEMSGYLMSFDANSSALPTDSVAFLCEEIKGQKYLTLFMESRQSNMPQPEVRASGYRLSGSRKLKYVSKVVANQEVASEQVYGYEWKYKMPNIFSASYIDLEIKINQFRRVFSRVPVRLIKS